MTDKRPTLLLVDGSSYLYRAFHAMPDLRAVAGDPASAPTGAIRGMVNMMQSLAKEVPAGHVACVFDASGPTFRDAIYPAYKAQRAPMPDDLRAQIEPIHALVRLLGWAVLNVPGVEADDVIGTLAVAGQQQGFDVVVSSGDKDLAQLVTAHITIIDTMNGKRRDLAGVEAEFGVPARLMVDFQTLVGDTVDNVPGVPKVGPKTAAKWLQEFGSLEALVARADEVKGVAGQNLRDALGWLPTGRSLVTIKTDCDLAGCVPGLPSLESIAVKPANTSGLNDFYAQFGFKGLLRSVADKAGKAGAVAAPASATHAAPTAGLQTPSGTALHHTDGASAPLHRGDTGDLFAPPPADGAIDGTMDAAAAAASAVQVDTVTDWPLFDTWLARVQAAELTALDTETTSLDPMQAQVVGISLCVTPGHAAYIPLAHDYPDAPAQLPRDAVLARLKPWLENPAAHKLGQHVKYDRHVLANHGVEVQGFVHDTMLQSYVLEVHRPHGLSSLAERHLGRGGITYEDLCGKGAHQIPFSHVEVARAAEYAGEDADQTLAVHQVLWPLLQASTQATAPAATQVPSPQADLLFEPPPLAAPSAAPAPDMPRGLQFIYQLEMASSEALYRIERNGVLIDAPTLATQSAALGQRIQQLEADAYDIAGQPFNLASPKQLGEIFFDKLGLPVVKKTATGARSTDEEVLEKLAEDYPLPAKILEHRSLSKLKGTYTDKLAQLAQPRTGRVHTHYAQAVAVTGRLSSNEPNLQNIPVRTAEGRRVREAFVAPPGSLIASADYSQIELRIMAHISGDPALLKAFADGLDVHRATAAEVFGIGVDQVSTEQRRYAKVINFGLIYGMSGFGLAKALGIDNTAAKNYIQRYFERFAGVKQYMDNTRAQAKAQGYVETVFGRRLYLPEINSPNGPRRAGAERAAINAPMQGTAADLIKLSMVAVQQALDAQQRATKMIMQVHDELVFEVPESEVDWVRTEVPRLMAGVAALKVPLLAEVGVGPNWDKAH